jgi:SRSO17 transposase
MTENQIAKCRQRLERFLLDLLEPIGRSERRHWGELYVRGLLQNGERKSIEPMAARLPDGNVQAMQQFVGQSPWEWQEVWARLGKRMTAELEPDSAWVVDDTGFPKQGEDSVGVDRQYSGTLGKTGNCQVAVSLHHAGEQGNAVLGWRLYLPETWAKDRERRQAAGVPEGVVFKKKWELALDLIDPVRAWGVPDRIVLADGGYGEATEFRDALEERGLRYAVGISPQVGVWIKAPKIKVPEYSGRGAPPKKWDYGDQRPSSVKEVAQKAKGWKKVRWREGTKGWLESRFLALRVQPSHGFVDGDPPHKEIWLLVEWPEAEKEPIKYFFCDLLLVAAGEGAILADQISPALRPAFPSSGIISERSSPSRVRFAAPNNGAPLTAPGRSENPLLIRGKGSFGTAHLTGDHFAAKLVPFFAATDYLSASYTLRRLVRIAKCRWKIEQDYHQLKEELGLDHYEGRSWNGWHHHVTMVMLAHSFLTLETLRSKKNFWVDPAEDPA